MSDIIKQIIWSRYKMIEIDQTNAANYHIFLKDTKLFTVFSVHKVYSIVCLPMDYRCLLKIALQGSLREVLSF